MRSAAAQHTADFSESTGVRAYDDPPIILPGVEEACKLTHMNMVKTQVYLPRKELAALHRIAPLDEQRVAMRIG